MEEQEERFENLLRLSKGLFDRLNGIAADDYQE